MRVESAYHIPHRNLTPQTIQIQKSDQTVPTPLPHSVFATRLTTSPPIYNKIHRQFTYRRFAARAEGENLEGYETEDVGVFATTNRGEKRERRLIGMNWPAFERREVVDGKCHPGVGRIWMEMRDVDLGECV